jgi:hypothetical protein
VFATHFTALRHYRSVTIERPELPLVHIEKRELSQKRKIFERMREHPLHTLDDVTEGLAVVLFAQGDQ